MRLLVMLLCFALLGAQPAAAASQSAKNALEYASRRNWDSALPAAKQSGDSAAVKLVTWQYIMDPDSGASFATITRFIDENPRWPDQKKLRVRAEQSLAGDDNVPDHDIIAWFEGETPITGVGKLALADALRRGKLAGQDKLAELIRAAWKDGDFDEATEKKLLSQYGGMLRSEDHIARADRLLWEERTGPAKRMLPLLPDGQQKLAKARMALIAGGKLAIVSVGLVPSSLKNNPGLIYERMRYRARKDDDKGVREMLLLAPDEPPYASKWWKYRESEVRQLLGEGKHAEAMKLLEGHGQTEGANMADALWLEGWIKCEFQDQARAGYDDFAELYDNVKYPVSRARAAYWAARAAQRLGDAQNASAWLARAAQHPTTFYGQLALLEQGKTSLNLPAAPRASGASSEMVKIVRLALSSGQDDLANRLLTLLIENSTDSGEIAELVELGEDAGMKHVSVHAAKKALQQNVVLIKPSYPLPNTPATPLERPLTLAITRQESEFDPRAKSPSGALGMMQLLPGTAKETARKNGLNYSLSRLYEPEYNMTLGSMYLNRMINSYDGSYVMAIAAYNAGPGNVRKFVQRFGTPENKLHTAINWIETIPFPETRNYVQRVLENLQVYRALHGQPLSLDKDLMR